MFILKSSRCHATLARVVREIFTVKTGFRPHVGRPWVVSIGISQARLGQTLLRNVAATAGSSLYKVACGT
jgi:hypothetical protein